jgi:hypothetical protein
VNRCIFVSENQLIFDRRVNKRTPGSFRTRVLTAGVEPTLRIAYKRSHIKQCFKEGRALRTETTINDTRDFGVGRSLKHFDHLRRIGRNANRRLLSVERLSHNCASRASSSAWRALTAMSSRRRAVGSRSSSPKATHASSGAGSHASTSHLPTMRVIRS